MNERRTKLHGVSGGTMLVLIGLLALTLLVQTAHLTKRLNDENHALTARLELQKPVLAEVDRVQQQLESLAGQTAILAEQGNANARQLQEQLRVQGITIRPPATKP